MFCNKYGSVDEKLQKFFQERKTDSEALAGDIRTFAGLQSNGSSEAATAALEAQKKFLDRIYEIGRKVSNRIRRKEEQEAGEAR